MFVADGFAVDAFEHFLYILVAFPTAFVGLAPFEAASPYHLLKDRQSCDLADALCDLFTLVVASLALALFSEGNRDNSVDSIEESRGLDLFGKHPSDDGADLRAVLVFQLVDDVGCFGMRLIIEEGGGAFDGYLSPEESGHLVLIGIEVESCAGQVEVALGTDDFFCHG